MRFMNLKKWMAVGLLSMMMLALAAACSNNSNEDGAQPTEVPSTNSPGTEQPSSPPEPPKQPDPVELSFYNISGIFSDDEFHEFFFTPLKEKYPHISFVVIPRQNTNSDFNEMVATNSMVDIIVGSNGDSNTAITRVAAEMDITPLIKQFNFDLTQIEPGYLSIADAISGGDGKMFALPLYAGGAPIYYNKDIFDKFGVDYPADNQSWDDLYVLSQRLARRDGDVQYYGFLPDPVVLIHMNPRSLPMLDATGLKPAFNTGEWASYLTQFKRFLDFPGYEFASRSDLGGGRVLAKFNQELTLAMFLSSNLRAPSSLQAVENWDITALPTFSDRPGVGLMPYAYYGYVTNTSKHPEDAFQALAYFASDEFQLIMSRDAKFKPISASNEVKTAFASNPNSFYAGKNVAAIFANEPAPLATSMFTEYHNTARGPLLSGFQDFLLGNSDINTILREGAEAALKAIETAEAAKAEAK